MMMYKENFAGLGRAAVVILAMLAIVVAMTMCNRAALGAEEPWGYSYTPVVITWYGEDIPKFKHELESFYALGAAADKPEQLQECEDKSREVGDSLKKSVAALKDKLFGYIVLCVRRPLEKPVEKAESESK